jgi:PAS domain S-box-containing protein
MVVAGDPESAEHLKEALDSSCRGLITVSSMHLPNGATRLEPDHYQAVVLDSTTLGVKILPLICDLRQRIPHVPVIVVMEDAEGSAQPGATGREAVQWFIPRGALSYDRIQECMHAESESAGDYWERRYSELTAQLRDGIVVWDARGIIQEVNPVCCDVSGWSQEELVGMPVTAFFDPEDLRENPLNMFDILKGTRLHVERKFIRRDGEVLWIELSSRLLENGKIQTLVRDVTETHLAAESLRQQSSAIKASMDGMAILNGEGRYLFLNDVYSRMHGYDSPESLLGHRLEMLYDETEVSRFYGEILPLLRRDGKWRGEAIGTRVDGTQFPQEVTLSTTEYGGIVMILRDITDRKKAEQVQAVLFRITEATAASDNLEELLETMRRELSTLLDTTNFYIALYDPATETYSFPYFADQYDQFSPGCRKLPRTLTDYVRRTGTAIFVDENIFHQLSEQGEVALCGTDSKLWLGVPLKTAAGIMGVMVVQSYESTTLYSPRDVDLLSAISGSAAMAIQRKRTLDALIESEAQLRQSQKMEAIGRLAGGVAHDFNNLLTSILGHSELTLFKLHASDPLREGVEQVIKSAERAASLTRQLLAFSRKQVLETRVLKLNGIVSDMEKMLRRLIGEDIELVTRLHPELGAVKADPGQMEQVVMNLAVNARDAMPKGGRLVIETENIDLDDVYVWQHRDVVPGKYVLLSVTDNGCGMSPEVQSHIFEPFFTTKDYGKGTGLGLSTVYGIVNQSGGYVWVYSEMGQGTTFKIYLPLVSAEEEISEQSIPVEVKNGTETVLLVEDESGVRELVKRILQERGYTVLEARLGEDALRIAAQNADRIQLLLSDVIMPGLGGGELAEQVTQNWPGIKVLLMSGYTDDSIITQGGAKRYHAFLAKPFTADGLIRKVRSVLDAEECAG